jgi:uncharacterized protein Smg (DUF494 family)
VLQGLFLISEALCSFHWRSGVIVIRVVVLIVFFNHKTSQKPYEVFIVSNGLEKWGGDEAWRAECIGFLMFIIGVQRVKPNVKILSIRRFFGRKTMQLEQGE